MSPVARGEPAPHRLALAVRSSLAPAVRAAGHDAGAGGEGDRGRPVRGAVVDDDQLVDEAGAFDELPAHRVDDRADRRLLVASRDADRDPAVPLDRAQLGQREVPVVV